MADRHVGTVAGTGVLKSEPPERARYRFEIFQHMRAGLPGTYRIKSHITPIGGELRVYLEALAANDPIELELETGEIVQISVTGMIPFQPDSLRTSVTGGEVLLEKLGLS